MLNGFSLQCLLLINMIFHLVKTLVNCVRCASKKAGGSSRNRKGHAIGKRRGLKATEGEYVTQSSILLRQRGIRMHPGLNVT